MCVCVCVCACVRACVRVCTCPRQTTDRATTHATLRTWVGTVLAGARSRADACVRRQGSRTCRFTAARSRRMRWRAGGRMDCCPRASSSRAPLHAPRPTGHAFRPLRPWRTRTRHSARAHKCTHEHTPHTPAGLHVRCSMMHAQPVAGAAQGAAGHQGNGAGQRARCTPPPPPRHRVRSLVTAR